MYFFVNEQCKTLLASEYTNKWRRKWQPTPVFLAWEIPWTEGPARLQSMSSQRVGHVWVHTHVTNKTWIQSYANSLNYSFIACLLNWVEKAPRYKKSGFHVHLCIQCLHLSSNCRLTDR